MKFKAACFAISVASLSSCASQQECVPEKVSAPFEYSGYSTPLFTSYEKHSSYIPMSDGALIAIDFYVPAGYTGEGDAPTAFPTILAHTPYLRASIDPVTGELFDDSARADAEDDFVAHGYAIAISDTRGTGASSGTALIFGKRYQEDACEVIDWLTSQSWSDGKVGMTGGSHVGWTQLAAASLHPKGLKAIIPAVVPFEAFTGQFRPGGIFLQGFLLGKGLTEPDGPGSELPPGTMFPAPVVDEDKDGLLHDEYPIDLDGSGVFWDDYDPSDSSKWPPQYADGVAREHLFARALIERALAPEDDYHYSATSIDQRSASGETFRDLCSNLIPAISKSDIAVYHLGSWFDAFVDGSFQMYASLAGTNPSRIMILPGYHSPRNGFVYAEQGVAVPDLIAEYRRFFDYYLRDIDNGIADQPPIVLYNINGDGWRTEDEWPLGRAKSTSFYLTHEGLLTTAESTVGAISYLSDDSVDRRYGGNKRSRWMGMMGVAPTGHPDMDLADSKSLLYTAAPLANAIDVTGTPLITLWVSSTEDYGDFHVYLEDVDPDGHSTLVTEGQLRAGWAAVYDNDGIVSEPGFDVLPDLPWHGFQADQWQEAILENGNKVELQIAMMPTSWTFRKGHSLRVAIATSNWPDFELHPKLSASNEPGDPDNLSPTITISSGPSMPSRLELPIVSGKN